MRWNYNPEYRKLFSQDGGVHCNILIVPHATNVTPVEGGPPVVTSKVPQFDEEGNPIRGQYEEVAFTITNEDIVKEKFEYSYALNSADDLTFCSAESACLKFTIRNLKEFIIDDEETGKGHYELCIPNLQKYEIKDETTGNMIVGEIDSRTIIKLYLYYEGDSSTMIYMGMFIVEEDKVSEDGYERNITAYDFLTTLRDMDIYEWYKRLFKGVHKTDKKTGEEIEDQYWPGLVGKDVWTIEEALQNLFTNLARFDPVDESTGKKKKTVTNPSDYRRDYSSDEYGGYGMPIMLDPDLLDETKTYHIPSEAGDENDPYECYGYMSILKYEFMCDDSIIRAGSLSLGKFLEDIGMLAGRYPCIRLDKIHDDWFWGDTPETAESGPGPSGNPNWTEDSPDAPNSMYQLYESCILTFKPLPRKDATIEEENCLSSSEIAKGFKADYYNVGSIMYMEVYNREDKDPIIRYGNLTKEQRSKMEKGYHMPSYIISNNTFTSYLTPNKDKLDEDLKNKYTKLIDELANDTSIKITIDPDENPDTENEKIVMRYGEGYLHEAYKNMKYREYVPYEITTTADPCRDVGDRITINTIDKVTGEERRFDSYILERKLSGIQAMMDTYTAKGNPNGAGGFSDYRSGTKSGSSYAMQSFGYYGYGNRTSSTDSGASEEATGKTSIIQNITGLTSNDFIEIIRNIGFRLLDEPTKVSVEYGVSEVDPSETFTKSLNPPSGSESDPWTFVECLTELTDECETNPITLLVNNGTSEVQKQYTAKKYDSLPYDGGLFTFGKDGKWHRIESTLTSLVQHPGGNYVFNTPQDGNEDNRIEYYYLNNGVVTQGTYEAECGEQVVIDGVTIVEGRSNKQSFLYPGYWWGAETFPYIDENFSGEDAGLLYKYNYYGNTAFQNGYTTPPGMNELDTHQVSGESGNRLVTGLTDESNQNPLVYVSSTGDIYSYVRSYCVMAYKEDASESTLYDPEEYYIYGTDDKWHLHKPNCLKVFYRGDTIPDTVAAIQTGSTENVVEIDDKMLEVSYGDYIIRPIEGTNHDEQCTYNYPGVWYVEDILYNIPTLYPTSTIYVEELASRKPAVFLKWTDPDDITTNRPAPAIWAGTVVVRKEGSAPLNRWESGVKLIKNIKTRNKYRKKSLIDDTVKENKKYYYGIFPYDTNGDYRFTKVVKVNTKKIYDAPEITELDPVYIANWDGSETTILWSGNNNKLTAKDVNDELIFTFYTGNTEIYNFTALTGFDKTDIDRIHISFLIDSGSEVAKPSFIYETTTGVYTYNNEQPSNLQMCAIYDWLNNV